MYTVCGAANRCHPLAAEAVVLAVQYAALRQEIRPAVRAIPFGKILLAAAAASAAGGWIGILGLGSFLTLLLAAAVFFGVYGGVLLATKEPLTREIVGQVFSKLRSGKKGNAS